MTLFCSCQDLEELLNRDDLHPALRKLLDHDEIPGEVCVAADDVPCGPDQCGFQQLVVGWIPADPQVPGRPHDPGSRLDQEHIERGFCRAEAANALEAGARQHPGKFGEAGRRGDDCEAPRAPLRDEPCGETLWVEEGRDPDVGV